jgi:hypothetical protein
VSERTWEKYGAATGIAFGLLLVVAIFAAPQPPHVDATGEKVLAYFTDHRRAVEVAGVFGAFASLAAILFIAHLRHVFDRVEKGIEGLSTVIFAAGIATVGVAALSGMIQTALAFTTVQPGDLISGGLARVMYDLVYVANGTTFLFVALFLAALAIGMVRGEVANAGLGWFAAVVAAVCVVAGVAMLTVSSYSAAWSTVGLVAILGVAGWSIVAGATMLARPEAESVGVHRSLIAASH